MNSLAKKKIVFEKVAPYLPVGLANLNNGLSIARCTPTHMSRLIKQLINGSQLVPTTAAAGVDLMRGREDQPDPDRVPMGPRATWQLLPLHQPERIHQPLPGCATHCAA